MSPDSIYHAAQHSSYQVLPLGKDLFSGSSNPDVAAWLHLQVNKTYALVYFHCSCKAWVTDSKNGGNPIKVAFLTCSLFVPGSSLVPIPPPPPPYPGLPVSTQNGENTDNVSTSWWTAGTFNVQDFPVVATANVSDPTYGSGSTTASV